MNNYFDESLDEFEKTKKRVRKLRAVGAHESGWQSKLVCKKSGDIIKCLANVITVLSCDERWHGVIAYDAFGESVVTTSPAPVRTQDAPADHKAGEWTEEDSTRTVAWLTTAYGLDVGTGVVDQAVATIARRNEFHPVRDYLSALTWDGTARLDGMLVTYFSSPDSDYTRAVSCRWMISAVARIFRPGCQADCALILESLRQGAGKSTGLKALVPNPSWFADTGLSIGNKDSYQSLRRKWIYELSELTGMRGNEVERVKQFISSTSDNYRPSYGKRNRDFQRQNVFVGTTNEPQYLADRSGNRRFLPVPAPRVDRAGLARDRDQLWAEARVRFERNEEWHINTPELVRLCEQEQAARVHGDAWEDVVGEYLSNPMRSASVATIGFSTKDVLTEALKIEVGKASRGDEMRLGGVLRTLGYAPKLFGTKRIKRWFSIEDGLSYMAQESRQVSPDNTQNNHIIEIPEIPEIPNGSCAHENGNVEDRADLVLGLSRVSGGDSPHTEDGLFADWLDAQEPKP